MALITCPECNRQISDQASACPQCGFPLSDDSATGPRSPLGSASANLDVTNPKTLSVAIGGLAIFVGLVAGGILTAYALAFRSIENPVPIESGSAGLLALGALLTGLQIPAGIGLMLRQPWAMKLAQPTALGAAIIALLSCVPVFARGMSMLGPGVAIVLVIGYVATAKVVLKVDDVKNQTVGES